MPLHGDDHDVMMQELATLKRGLDAGTVTNAEWQSGLRSMAIQLAHGMRTLHLPAYPVPETLFLLPH